MSKEIRNLDTRYFELDGAFVGRTERVRGDFDAYGGAFETLSETWWLESNGVRSNTTLEQIGELIKNNLDCDPVGLANFFAYVNNLGSVISENFTQLIDFEESFGRAAAEVFPRIAKAAIEFTTAKSLGDPGGAESEVCDVSIDLRTLRITRKLLWSGSRSELSLRSDPSSDE